MSRSNPNILDKATPKTPSGAAEVAPIVPGSTRGVLVGRKIIGVRRMTDAEMKFEGWGWGSTFVLVLDDGTLLYPSEDVEGNGPGMIFGRKGRLGFVVITPE